MSQFQGQLYHADLSSTKICQNFSGPVLMNWWRSQLCWSLIFCETYKFLCNMWCVKCNAWCSRLDFFCRILTPWVKGDLKHPISVISNLCNDIPKLIPGGSRMYTISCKASYSHILNSTTYSDNLSALVIGILYGFSKSQICILNYLSNVICW